MESLSRKSKIGASSTNSPNSILHRGHQSSNSNLYTSQSQVEGYHIPSTVVMSQGHNNQLYGPEGAPHLHQYEELKVLIPEYGSRKALIYSNGHGLNQPLQQPTIPNQRRNDMDNIGSSLRPGRKFF